MNDLTRTTLPGQAQTWAVNQQSDGQSVTYNLAWRHKQPIYFSRPNGRGPYCHPTNRLASVESVIILIYVKFLDILNEPPRGKTNNVVSEQVWHKPACTVTEAG